MQDRSTVVISVSDVVAQYDAHLLKIRGLSKSTRNLHRHVVHRLLSSSFPSGHIAWSEFCFSDVVQFVTGEFQRLTSRATQHALRHTPAASQDGRTRADFVPQPQEQTDIAARPQAQYRHGSAPVRRRHCSHRSMARPREHPNDQRISPRQPRPQGERAGETPTRRQEVPQIQSRRFTARVPCHTLTRTMSTAGLDNSRPASDAALAEVA